MTLGESLTLQNHENSRWLASFFFPTIQGKRTRASFPPACACLSADKVAGKRGIWNPASADMTKKIEITKRTIKLFMT